MYYHNLDDENMPQPNWDWSSRSYCEEDLGLDWHAGNVNYFEIRWDTAETRSRRSFRKPQNRRNNL